jgi:hypothetical protein
MFGHSAYSVCNTSIAQENKLGQRYIAASDFLKNGIPASILATAVIVTLGFGISKAIGYVAMVSQLSLNRSDSEFLALQIIT